jgi:hypothetical protein
MAITLLNFKGGTKPTNHNHTWANYYKLLTGYGVTNIIQAPKRDEMPKHTTYL